MNNKKISIIVPVYNVKEYIEKCIYSIINQTYQNIEIIIIDDGSNDGSSEICDELAKKDSRIIVIHKKNEGVSSARNIGIANATGSYIGFVDSDDFVEPNLFNTLLECMELYNSEMSTCNYNIVTTKETKCFYHGEIENDILIINSKDEFYRLLNKNYYKGFLWNKLFKTEIVKKIGFDNNIYMCEDLLFVVKYAEQCNKFTFYERPLYNYVIRKGSAIKSKVNRKTVTVLDAYNEIIKIIYKYVPTEVPQYEYSKLLWMNTIVHEYRDEKSNIRHKEYIDLYKKNIKTNSISCKKKCILFIRTRFYFVYRLVNRIYHYRKD